VTATMLIRGGSIMALAAAAAGASGFGLSLLTSLATRMTVAHRFRAHISCGAGR
jgi:hypothetical protein